MNRTPNSPAISSAAMPLAGTIAASGQRRTSRSTLRVGCMLIVALLTVAIGGVAFLAVTWNDRSLVTETAMLSAPVCGEWRASTGPGLGGTKAEFNATTAFAPTDVWAVGTRRNTLPLLFGSDLLISTGNNQPYTAHWNGTEWESVPIGTPNDWTASLRAVAGVAPDDIWAVGYFYSGKSLSESLTVHWNGKAWSVVKGPNLAGSGSTLYSVAALAPNNVWAAGFVEDSSGTSRPLIIHWDGQSWAEDRSLDLSRLGAAGGEIYAIAAVSDKDIWAVGSYYDSKGERTPLSLHWNGANWRVIPMPFGPNQDYPQAITAVATDDIWAVGTTGLAMHWDGKEWRIVPTPLTQAIDNLEAVVALSSTDVWAVGGNAYGNGPSVVIHWDGRAWSRVESPTLKPGQVFHGLARASANELWAVGGTLPGREEGPWYALASHLQILPCIKP